MSRAAAFRFLCDCLSGLPPERLRQEVQCRDFAWATFIAVAHEYRVACALLPLLEQHTLSPVLPKDAVAFFTGCAAHRRQQNQRVRDEAIEVAGILNRIDVTPLFMKGGAHLLAGLYPDLAIRPMADLDILVPAGRIDDCVTALKANGIVQLTDYLHPRGHHGPPLGRSDLPVPVEPHHQVLAHPSGAFLTADEMRGSAILLDGHGARIAVPSPACAVIHNIAHAQLNDHDYLYGRIDLRGLLDLALLTRAHGDTLDWAEICRRFARNGARTALGYHLLCAGDLLSVEAPVAECAGTMSRLLYRRALYQVRKPNALSLSVRLLQPWTLLRRELSEPELRGRLARNMIDPAWWKRHMRMLVGR